MLGFASLAGPLLFAHRGARLELPENTLPAFERAHELGADVLELDVHATRDGHVVVCHDADLARMAGRPRRIRDLSLAELQALEVRRPEEPGVRARVPTLLELLEQLPSAVLNVDVKEARALGPTLEVIRGVRAEPRVLLTSFYSYVTLRARWAGYPGPRGLGREEVLLAASVAKLLGSKLLPGRALTRIKAVYAGCRIQIPTAAQGVALDGPDLIRAFHDLGLAVDYWVINDRARAQQLLARGADGIITDDPRALRSCFEAAPETAAWRARHRHAPVPI